MKIGSFHKDSFGDLHGKIYGLGLGVTPVVFEPKVTADEKPYFKIIAEPLGEAYEVGAAFPKEKDGVTYYSVTIETPVIAGSFNAALFPDKDNDDQFNLIWNKPIQAKLEARAEAGQSPRRSLGAGATP